MCLKAIRQQFLLENGKILILIRMQIYIVTRMFLFEFGHSQCLYICCCCCCYCWCATQVPLYPFTLYIYPLQLHTFWFYFQLFVWSQLQWHKHFSFTHRGFYCKIRFGINFREATLWLFSISSHTFCCGSIHAAYLVKIPN